jgi:HEAT repeat protein
MNLLVSNDGALWGDASTVLHNIGAPAVPALIEALGGDSQSRNYVLYTLRGMGLKAAPAVPAMIAVLNGKDQALANIAADCLPELGPDAKKAVPDLLRAVKSEDATLCRISAAALARIDAEQIPHTISPLVAVIRGNHSSEKGQALWLLNSFGARAKPAVPALVEMLKTENLGTRLTIVDVLTRIDPEQIDACIPTLTTALASGKENRSWPNQAVRILGQFGPRAKSVGPTLRDALQVSLKNVGKQHHPSAIAECMKKIGAQDLIVPVVIAAFDSKNQDEREEAQYIIEDLGRSALAPLEAAIANGQLRETQQVTALVNQLRKQAGQ